MVIHRYDAELARVLGGIREGGTVLLAGEGGVGKSTTAAELAVAVAEARGGFAYWLDRDQQAHDLVAALFERVGATGENVVLVEDADANDIESGVMGWREALATIPREAACIVLDSLETWAESYADQSNLARALAAHPAMVKLVLCGTNASGEVEGLARLRRAGDAVVLLREDAWEVRKCRWLPGCPQIVLRAEPAPRCTTDRILH
jgi:energy-coupling factor transporter ATP-binding protein EcfA2